MADLDEFTSDEKLLAFIAADGKCECCGKRLSLGKSSANPDRGQWEAHHGGRETPVVLCIKGPENCHLNCGHDGDFKNPGIVPRVHKGG